MDSIALQIEKTTPPMEGSEGSWMDAATAAERLKLTEQAIRRRCAKEWEPAGLARQARPDQGGKARWLICPHAHPALRANPLPGDIPVSTRTLTEAQREELGRRIAILHEWQAACEAANKAHVPNAQRLTKEDATRLFLAKLKTERGMELTARTLRSWYRRSRGAQGAAGLLDGRWEPAGKAPVDDPFLMQVRTLYMTRAGLSIRYCHKLAKQKARETNWRVWGYRKTAQIIEGIPLAERIHAREGDKAYTDKAESYINRDWTPVAANEDWGSDHHKMDLWVRTGQSVDERTGLVSYRHVRPTLTVWMDNASRKILAWDLYTGDPSTDHIIVSFRRAVLAYGVPESVWVDNGKDYDSYALHGRTKRERRSRRTVNREFIFGTFALLGVKAHNVQTYHGQSKVVERFFGTMEGQLCRLFPESYCGNTPAHRPEGLQERLDAGKAPTLDEVAAAFAEWVENVYNAGTHTGEGMAGKSPNQVYAEKLGVKRTAPQNLLDLLLLKHSKPVQVTQNGVRCNGFQYGQHEMALKRLLGQKVVVAFDPDHPARVVILTEAGKLVCGADSNRRVPANATAADMQAAMKAKRHARKVELEYRHVRPHLHESPLDLMYEMAAQRAQETRQTNPDPPPAPHLRPIRSPFETQLPQIQEAIKAPALRPAVGMENVDLLAFANRELELPRRSAEPAFNFLTALNDDSPADAGGGGASCP